MSGPWMKFYPSDWRADPALRMCSIAARGLWMEMLCLMHEAEPRGTLRVNGRPLTDRQIGTLAGCDVGELLSELEEAGVFSRDDEGTIYSRRMMRDEAKAKEDKANGKRGGNPALKGGDNPPDKAQKPEAKAISEKEAPSGASKKRATRLPADWVIPNDWVQEAIDAGLTRERVLSEAERMKNWSLSSKNGAKLNWQAAWRNWFKDKLDAPSPRAASPPRTTQASMWRDEARKIGILPNERTDQNDGRMGQGHATGPDSLSGFARRIASSSG